MCIVGFYYPKQQKTNTDDDKTDEKKVKFVLVFNRDEILSRSALPAHHWQLNLSPLNSSPKLSPKILSGIDVQTLAQLSHSKELINNSTLYKSAGTWLGISQFGKIAFVTNISKFYTRYESDTGFVSRGKLVTDYLVGTSNPEEYLTSVLDKIDQFEGFNLAVGNLITNKMLLLAHPPNVISEIGLGDSVCGVSNTPYGAELPKVPVLSNKLLNAFKSKEAQSSESGLIESIIKIMGPDPEAQKFETIKDLGHNIFIPKVRYPSPDTELWYGTLSTTVVTVMSSKVRLQEYLWIHPSEENPNSEVAKPELSSDLTMDIGLDSLL